MKNSLKTTACQRLAHMAPLLSAAMLTSCSTSPNTQATSGQIPSSITRVNQRNWVKVLAHPPTWYPRGVANDVPTDHRNGEWVSTGDEVGSRFFIPLRGIPTGKRQELIKEAIGFRAPEIKPNAIGSIATNTALMPVAVALSPLVFAGMIYTPWYFNHESDNPALQR